MAIYAWLASVGALVVFFVAVLGGPAALVAIVIVSGLAVGAAIGTAIERNRRA